MKEEVRAQPSEGRAELVRGPAEWKAKGRGGIAGRAQEIEVEGAEFDSRP